MGHSKYLPLKYGRVSAGMKGGWVGCSMPEIIIRNVLNKVIEQSFINHY